MDIVFLVLPTIFLSSLYYPPHTTPSTLSPTSLLFPSILSIFPELLTIHLLPDANPDPEIYRTNNTCLQIYNLSRLYAIQGLIELQTILFRFSFWLGQGLDVTRNGYTRLSLLEEVWKHNKGGVFDWESPVEMRHLDFVYGRPGGSAWIRALSVYLISWRLSVVYPILPGIIHRVGKGVPYPLDITTLLGVVTGLAGMGIDVIGLYSLYVNGEDRHIFVRGILGFIALARIRMSVLVCRAALGWDDPPGTPVPFVNG